MEGEDKERKGRQQGGERVMGGGKKYGREGKVRERREEMKKEERNSSGGR